MCNKCLTWDSKERKEIEDRILKLTDNQIEELFEKVGISWIASLEEMEEIVSEIRKQKHDSINLDTLMSETDSRENLLKWIEYYEKQK